MKAKTKERLDTIITALMLIAALVLSFSVYYSIIKVAFSILKIAEIK